MLNYLSIYINSSEDLDLKPSIKQHAGNMNLFDDTDQSILFLSQLIEELKKDTAELFLALKVEISSYSFTAIKEADEQPAAAGSNNQKLLSKREKEILQLVFDGMTNKEIANKLFISFETVKSHRKNILSKTESRNTASLIRKIDIAKLTKP